MAFAQPFQNPAPPPPPKPIVPPSPLKAALAQAAAQHAAASKAGSALAKKSHPQTLNQPAQQPAPQQPPSALLQGQIDTLQGQQQGLTDARAKADAAFQSAMSQPLPTSPTYNAPTMQQANPGLAIGAALAALFAPRAAAGSIGALGVDQTNRENQYKTDTDAAQSKYKAGLDAYQAQYNSRNDAISNAEKADTLADRNVKDNQTAIDSLTGREVTALETEAKLAETKAENDRKQQRREWLKQQFLMNYGQKNNFHSDLLQHYKDVLGVDNRRIDASLLMSSNRLAQQAQQFGVKTDQTERLVGMRIAASLVLQKDRDWQSNHRDQVRAAQSFLTNTNNTITQLMTHGQGPAAQAMVQRLIQQSGALSTSFKGLGISGDEASNLLDAQIGDDQGASGAVQSQDATGATIANPAVQAQPFEFGTAAAPVATSPDASGVPPDLVSQARALMGGSPAASKAISGLQSGGGAQKPATDPVLAQVHKDLPQALPLYEQALKKHGGNAAAAMQDLAPGFAGMDPKEASMLKRALVNQTRGSQHSGNGRAPASSGPGLRQALTQAGISPALLPLQAR